MENATETSINSKTTKKNARVGGGSGTMDSISLLLTLGSPIRDILLMQQRGFVPVMQQQTVLIGGGNDCYTPPPCNGISFPLQPGGACDPAPPFDAFGNPLSCWASYGPDPRQKYYVYYPTTGKTTTSPIVLLIHGGGLISGPNPDETIGCPFNFSDDANSIVNDLRSNGFIVVSMIYRLTPFCKDEPEVRSNHIYIQDQINDVGAAIAHIRTNFPTCLNVNANSIQILGESAGGLLALDWTYNYATLSYIKSVIACYTPTNFKQYANYIMNRPLTYSCSVSGNSSTGNYITGPVGTSSHFPYYSITDITLTNPVVATISPFTCGVTKLNGNTNPLNLDGTPIILANYRVYETYQYMQGAMKDIIPAPLTSSVITPYNPVDILSNNNHNAPTFIMHGKDNADVLVPYTKSTDNFSAKLTNSGGLINTYTYYPSIFGVELDVPSGIPTTYSPTGSKHLVKVYDQANHGFASINPTYQLRIKNKVRSDIVKWMNGHK